MIKTLSIGDLHGSKIWKTFGDIQNLINNNDFMPEYDYYIFMGDFTDSFTISDKDIYDNIVDLINFKKLFPDRVIFLVSNHDLQYMFDEKMFGCSGFRLSMKESLHKLFNDNIELFTPIFELKGKTQLYIWTHAGISYSFLEKYLKEDLVRSVQENTHESLSEMIFKEFQKVSNKVPIFYAGKSRGGNHDLGGIFWADMTETYIDLVPNSVQIIGHTHIKVQTHIIGKENNENYYIDCLGVDNRPLILDVK